MEGDSPNTSTQSSPNPVPQIPAEYDDLYLQQGSYTTQRDFSHDINKRMKVYATLVSTSCAAISLCTGIYYIVL